MDHQEVEWQFDALDVRLVTRWLEGYSTNGVSVTFSGERDIADSYLDTEDWSMYRAGYALRIREKDGKAEATMKRISAGDDAGLKKRREISEPLETRNLEAKNLSKSEGPVAERVRSLTGRKSLKPLFEVRTKRKTYEVSFGETVGEVALDETEIPVGNGTPVVIRRVEVELEWGAIEAVEPFVEELRRGCELAPATASKFGSGLVAGGLSPPEAPEFGPKEVSSTKSVGEVAYAVMRKQFETFLAHEPGTRIGEDPEELHDMRVASRRLRAAMQVFKDALPARSKEFRDELKGIAGVLGKVRDLDVQLERLEEWVSDSAPEDREPLGELREVLEERRQKARRTMLRALDSRRFARFVESYSAFLRRGPSRRAEARRPVLEAGPEVVRHRYRKVRKAGDVITVDSPGDEYHELRKRGKRLRYALEFLLPVYGKPAAELVKALKSLQDVLGDHQDAVVATAQLRELALPAKRRGGGVSTRTAFVMGGISHHYQSFAGELREEFPDAYGEIKGKRWKRLKKAMDEARPAEGRTPSEGSGT